MHDYDEDNDGKFPDESPVEVRWPSCATADARRASRPVAQPPPRGAGQAGDRGPGDPLHDSGRGLRRGRRRGGGQLFPHLRARPGPRPGRPGGRCAVRGQASRGRR